MCIRDSPNTVQRLKEIANRLTRSATAGETLLEYQLLLTLLAVIAGAFWAALPHLTAFHFLATLTALSIALPAPSEPGSDLTVADFRALLTWASISKQSP